jgi:hypothetical protein
MNRWYPPAQASDHPVTHRLQYSRWTKKPRQCTDAIHQRPVGSSGAEEHPLAAVLYVSNTSVGRNTELTSKRQFIRCWSKSFGASLYVLNATVGWTAGQGIRSSGGEEAEPYCCQTLSHRMNRCLYRRFIRRSVLNPLATQLIWRM